MSNNTPHLEDMISFLLVGVFLRGLIMPWIGKILAKAIKEWFIKTEREWAIWHHYHEQGRNKSKR